MVTKASAQTLATVVALLLALSMLALPGASHDARALETESFVPGQIIVKLAPGVSIGEINLLYNTQTQECFITCNDSSNSRVYLLKISNGANIGTKLNRLLADRAHIEYAELNYRSSVPESDAPNAQARHSAFPYDSAEPTANDYSENSLYPRTALNLAEAQAITKGAGTTVAILDTGAQIDHPALKTSFEGVPRYDFVSDDSDPSEPPLAKTKEQRDREVVGHGTHVAGIVHLVAPGAGLMPLRVLDREGYGTTFHIAEAVAYADRHGADVINLSLGSPSWSQLLWEQVNQATSDGTVVTAAAGNYNSREPQYPASSGPPWVASKYDGLLAVTSVNAEPKRSDFANYGTWVDIAAPGEKILSTYPVSRYSRSGYALWTGTSMATPFVAGEAALIHKVDGSLSASGIEGKIRCSARGLPDDPGHIKMGAGHADVGASLKSIADSTCVP
jgi:subtilisin family serine protease